jgi:4-hydroxy-2-oxoheptanedioate aldolase
LLYEVTMANRLLDKLTSGRAALGLYVHSPDMVELCGYLGFDWFMIDHMWTAADWGRTESLMYAGEAASITPVIRVQSNPWMGYDHRIVVDVSRALGIGAQFVLISNSGLKEIEECAEVSKDWHKKALTIHPYSSFEEWDEVRDQQNTETYVIPHPETKEALDLIEDYMAIREIRAVFIAMTDASRVLTGNHRPDFYDEKLWNYVDRAVQLGRQHGVVIGANTSYAYSMVEMAKRVRHLHEHGVQMILVQGAPFLFQVAMNEFLRELRPMFE